ncbi:MAG TPA: cell division protein [Microscillaceae bacterium]|nr:cell division protein [Microscillaceae bacterium]
MSIKRDILIRVQLSFLAVIVVSTAIVAKIAFIQFVEQDKWQTIAKENALDRKIIKATRGDIYAENDVLLATSVPSFKLSFDPMIASDSLYRTDIKTLCDSLSKHFQDKTSEEYYRKINDARLAKRRYLVLTNRLINYYEQQRIEKWPIFKMGTSRGGVIFEKIDKRTYPFGELAERLIGRIDEKGDGIVGLEKSFDDTLGGINGDALYQKIAGGHWKPIQTNSRVRPVDGFDIYTTIDINMQEIVNKQLRDGLEKYEADYGCAVVMDVKTGYIKAMANLNRKVIDSTNTSISEIYNYAIGDLASEDPGSTFKIASALALFNHTDIQMSDTVETGNRRFRYGDAVMTDDGPGGRLTVQQAFEYSSNIGVSKLMNLHFNQNDQQRNLLIDYFNKLWLAQPLNFQIVGEAQPLFKRPTDNTWSGTTIPWMSIGYESKVSPLQILTLYNAIANDGVMMKPQIVKEVRKANRRLKRFSPIILNQQIASPEAMRRVKTILRGVVQRGTARLVNSREYQIAGKTGTSQKRVGRVYKKIYKTSFAGYFPADDPKYSCIIMIYNPKRGKRSGGTIAAPVFRKIADQLHARDVEMRKIVTSGTFNRVDISNFPIKHIGNKKDLDIIAKELGIVTVDSSGTMDWVKPIPRKVAVQWKKHRMSSRGVPNVIGMTLRDALYVLENRKLQVSFAGRGRVKSQSVMPGAAMPSDGKILLILR